MTGMGLGWIFPISIMVALVLLIALSARQIWTGAIKRSVGSDAREVARRRDARNEISGDGRRAILDGLSSYRYFDVGTLASTLALILLSSLIHVHGLGAQTVDLEVDPIPYVLDGYSVAVGVGTDYVRYEAEAFGIDVPEAFHGNDGFSQRVRGASLKASYYFGGTGEGAFTGVDLDIASATITLDETGAEATDSQLAAGVTAGYTFRLTDDLYVKPWAGLTYDFGAEDISLDGRTFEQDPLSPFPALSIGWRF